MKAFGEKNRNRPLLGAVVLGCVMAMCSQQTQAVLQAVKPAMADVSSTAASIVNIDYVQIPMASMSLAVAMQAEQGEYCLALNPAITVNNGLSSDNPCMANSTLGYAPAAQGFSPSSSLSHETLTVPQTISRQAYLQAQSNGGNGTGVFYFVRHFTASSSPIAAAGQYAVVKLRLAGNAADQVLTLTQLNLHFIKTQQKQAIQQNVGFFKRGQLALPVQATIQYQGSGLLRAQWVLVRQGDESPTAMDLTPSSMQSSSQMVQQHIYAVVGRIEQYLPATGMAVLPSPDVKGLETDQYGQFKLMLHIEPSPANPVLAPFELPVLRYYVAEYDGSNEPTETVSTIRLLAPSGEVVSSALSPSFGWQALPQALLYKLEIQRDRLRIYSARVQSRSGNADSVTLHYTVPKFAWALWANKPHTQWRVVAFSASGVLVGESPWQVLMP